MKLLLASPFLLLVLYGFAGGDSNDTSKLWEYRNLGKAFYENPDTHQQAAEQLKKALDASPGSVRERVNYGLALLRAGQVDKGVAELLEAQEQDGSLPHTWFNLGIAYKHAGDYDKAIAQFQDFIKLVPQEPAGHYNLAAVYRSKGDSQAALAEFLEAEKLNPDLAGPHFQLFTLYQRARETDKAGGERQLFEAAKKKSEGAAVPEDMEWCYYAELYDPPDSRPANEVKRSFKTEKVSSGWNKSTHLLPVDARGDGHTDLLIWNQDSVVLLKDGRERSKSGLEDVKGALELIAGDYDNDGKADLCVTSNEGTTLFHNDGGSFGKGAELPRAVKANAGLWLDYDHDNDLDLLLFGREPALLRNIGNGRFEDQTGSYPFIKGDVVDAVVTAIRDDTAARDVVVSYASRPGTLYRDRLNAKFEAQDLPDLPAGSASLSAEDIDHDGLLDVVSYAPKKIILKNNAQTLQLATALKAPETAVRADFNSDGREDLAAITPSGDVMLSLDDSTTAPALNVRIAGVKNLKGALHSTVEVKAGSQFSKRIYTGVSLPFDLGGRTEADTVRITWPNGLIQNETQKRGGQPLNIEEAQRLSGSCPMIFTWNGSEFQFITDVLGVAPLGASSGDGKYFAIDHDEYIQIPASVLKEENGRYQVNITEELHEISYLDKVQLIALDHPSDLQIYTNDKFKSPPYPEFRLFGSRRPVHPLRAVEGIGHEVTAKVNSVDGVYPNGFDHNSSGVASNHTLELDFGKAAEDNRAVLVLNGWVDWADGSTFLGAAQGGHELSFPVVQVKNATGHWQTVVSDMGIPSGKPKTIAVDLSGKFLTADRHIRIVTNLCVYWDEIALLESSTPPQAKLTPLNASAADLHFRGFSKVIVDPRREHPEQFSYKNVSSASNWNPTAGHYTRYGDVQTLITGLDDKLVIMGSGDELKLQYSADFLPSLPRGWTRDYLLYVDGWAKDADANTAFSQSVLPLPFHGMSSYPYSSRQHFPDDVDHVSYQQQFLTRPALKLLRPLVSVR